MRRFAALLTGIFLCTQILLSAASAAGPDKSAVLKGSVQDSLGRPLAGAEVTLQGVDGREAARALTDAKGQFRLSGLPLGTCELLARKNKFKLGTVVVTLGKNNPSPVRLTLGSEQALSLAVAAQRLARARNSLSPTTGGSEYHFSQQAIRELPQGNNTPLNEVLLQSPGVVQDSYGQLHVRGEHADLQYRINGIQLPEGITGFGQVITPRFAESINLLTGALPAQFGLRTAGIIDIHTKTGFSLNGGDADVYGGQRGTLQPSFQDGGSTGKFDYFITGQYFQSNRGIQPPTAGPEAIHDQTYQGQGFGYFSYLLDPTSRLSLITGSAINSFEIPANPDQPPVYKLNGVEYYPSADVAEHQFEQNYFGVLAFQSQAGPKFFYQIA
jgi:hypothetical protein